MAKIAQARSRNFRRVKLVELKNPQHFTIIGGKNEQGKSSFLDHIESMLTGSKPGFARPVHEGATKAQGEIILDNGVKIQQYMTESTYGLKVTAPDGTTYNAGQTYLKQLSSALQYDPTEFLTLKPQQQVDELLKLMGVDFTDIDFDRKNLFDLRTSVNREIKEIAAKNSNHGLTDEDIESLPDEEVSTEQIRSQLQVAQEIADEARDLDAKIAACEQAKANCDIQTTSLKSQIEELEKQIAVKKEQIEEIAVNKSRATTNQTLLKQQRDKLELVDTSELFNQLSGVDDLNKRIRLKLQVLQGRKEYKEKQEKAEALTIEIEAKDRAKQKMLEDAEFPISGLSVQDDQVLYNGFPLSETSTGQQLRVCFAIAAARNPRLRVMLLRNANLLDEDNLRLIQQLAEEHDLQVLAEVVGQRDESTIVIEDGLVVGAEPEQAPLEDVEPKKGKGVPF